MADTIITPFDPSPNANFQFQANLDGAPYNVVCTWSAYGLRYYVNFYDLTGVEVLSRPLIASPDTANISLTAGYFDTTVIYRGSRAVFEIPGMPPIPLVIRPPSPPSPPPPPPPPPPTDPYWSDVVLLLHGEGANGSTFIQDSSQYSNILTTQGSIAIDTSKGKFSGGSISIPSGNWLWSMDELFAWNGADYTMEGWFYFPTLASADGQSIFCCRYEHTFDNGQMTTYVQADGSIAFYSSDSLGDNPVSFGTEPAAVPVGEWAYISLTQHVTVHTGTVMGTHYMHVNGILQASYTGRLSTSLAIGVNIGNYGQGAADQSFGGWMQEYRLTLGVARYTSSNYAVPTARDPNG